MSFAAAVGRIWICKRDLRCGLRVIQTSRRCSRNGAKAFLAVELDKHASSEKWIGMRLVPCGVGEVLRESRSRRPSGATKNSRMLQYSQSGPSPHEDCLAEDTFVDGVRGGVLETEKVKQARRERKSSGVVTGGV